MARDPGSEYKTIECSPGCIVQVIGSQVQYSTFTYCHGDQYDWLERRICLTSVDDTRCNGLRLCQIRVNLTRRLWSQPCYDEVKVEFECIRGEIITN